MRNYSLIFLLFLMLLLLSCSSNEDRIGETSLERGKNYYQIDNFEKSIDELNRAIESDSSDYEAYLWRGKARFLQNEYEIAIEDCDKALRLNPDNPTALIFKILSRYMQGDSTAVDSIYEIEIEADTDDELADGYYYRAWARMAFLGDTTGAVIDYDTSISISPSSKAYYNRGYARDYSGDTAGAIEDFRESVDILKKTKNISSYFSLGESYRSLSRLYDLKDYHWRFSKSHISFEKTYKYFTKALEIEPFAEGYYQRSFIIKRSKQLDDVQNAIQLNNNRPNYYLRGAEICLRYYYEKESSLRDPQYLYRAMDYLDEAIGRLPNARYSENKAKYYFRRGDTYYQLGDYSKALSDFRVIKELEPELPYS